MKADEIPLFRYRSNRGTLRLPAWVDLYSFPFTIIYIGTFSSAIDTERVEMYNYAMKVLTKKNKRALAVICSILLILAISLSIALPIVLRKPPPVSYSFENERKPLEYGAVNKLIFNNKIADILKYSFYIADKNNYVGNALLSAMSRARIPTEKMKAFADYLAEFVTLLKGSGFFVPSGEFEEDKEQQDSLFSNFNLHFKAFFEKTGFSEPELAGFLYELASDLASNTPYADTLALLGREDFITLTSNTIFCYNMLTDAASLGTSGSDARALQAVVYSLGSNYIKIIDKLGFENTEKLLGLDFDIEKQYENLTAEEYAEFSAAMTQSKNKIANLFYTLGSIMKQTDAYSFELLFSYISDKDGAEAQEKLVLSHIELSKAIKNGVEESYKNSAKTGVSDRTSFVSEYASLFTQYKKLLHLVSQSEEVIDFTAYGTAVSNSLNKFFDNIEVLAATDPKSLQGMSQEELAALASRAQQLWQLADGVEEYFDRTFAIRFANFVLKIIDIQGLLEKYRRPINDIIADSIKGLIDMEELEELIGQNN